MERKDRRHGFTLVELLVVMGTAAVLLMMVVPALVNAKEMARRSSCGSNVREIGIALHIYANNAQRYFPFRGGVPAFDREQLSDADGNFTQGLGLLLPDGDAGRVVGLGDPRTLFCPSEPDKVKATEFPREDGRHFGSYVYFGWDRDGDEGNRRNRCTLTSKPGRALAADLDVTLGSQLLTLLGRFNKTHRGLGHNVLYVGGHVRWLPIQTTATDPARLFYHHKTVDFR
jgi:prepilin-type N-terminal cleavage/methylation domain-containing protein/prepilin-type processing-associated H-X9-DG protein